MSSQIDPSPTTSKAQAKADKAYQKAMRPWFKKKRFIVPLILIAIMILATVFGGGENATTTSPAADSNNSQQQAAPPESTANMGRPVDDGKFQFTVTGIETPGKTIGDVLPEEAQGTWVIVRVDVTNTGNEAGMLIADSQKAFDSEGREFSAATAIGYEGWDKAFANEINPGNTVKDAPIVFDVPEGTTLDRIELHDSLFSNGTTVSLKQ